MAIERKKDLVYEHLKREILDKLLYPGCRLPREVELAKRLGVGQVTLRSALARLEAEGLVERMRGKGTFVSEKSSRMTFLLILPDGSENLETPSRYVASGIDEAAGNRAVTVERCPASLITAMSDSECQQMIEMHHIKGVLLETGHAHISDELLDRVRSMALPVVIPHGLPEDAARTGFLVLRTDERKAFQSGMDHLHALGHVRIASIFLDLPCEKGSTIRGFTREELLARAENSSGNSAMAYITNDYELLQKTVRNWMSMPDAPTAIICHSDRVAMRVYQVIKELKLRIPEQISILGYSNYPGSQLLMPALSTIDIKYELCGQMALEQLINADKWFIPGKAAGEIFTPFELLIRESTAGIP